MISEKAVRATLSTFDPNSFVFKYVEWAAQITDAPLVYHVGSALALLGVCAPTTLEMRAGGKVLPSFWSLLIGESRASRKTTAISLARDILGVSGCKYVGPHPGSTEGFLQSLNEAPKQLLIFGEYGDFLSKTEDGYLGPMREKLTEVYDGESQTRITVKKGSMKTDPPRVSLLAGVTPAYLEAHTKYDDWTGGFLARHVIFFARRERTNTSYARGLLGMQAQLGGTLAILDGADVGVCVGLSAGAQRAWDRWYVDVTTRFPADGLRDWARGVAEGAPSVALKVALLLSHEKHVTGQAEWEIPESVIAPAIAIAEIHVQSGLAVVDALAPTRHEQNRRSVLRALQIERPRPLSDVLRATRLSLRDAQSTLASLLAEKTIVVAAQPPGTSEMSYYIPQEEAEPLPANSIDFQAKRAERLAPAQDWVVEAYLSAGFDDGAEDDDTAMLHE